MKITKASTLDQSAFEAQPTSQYVAFDREIDVLKPYSFTPKLVDVMRALPKINRYNGQTHFPYSVAIHSICCTNEAYREYGIAEPESLLAVLFHDAAEAYIGDIVRPIKRQLDIRIFDIEGKILAKIYEIFGFSDEAMKRVYSTEFQEILAEIDTRMAATEADVLLQYRILPNVQRFPATEIIQSTWQQDYFAFNTAFNALLRIENASDVTKMVRKNLAEAANKGKILYDQANGRSKREGNS